MGLLSRIFSGRTETRAAADYLPQSFGIFGGGSYNDTGVTITESNALICSAVWACVSIIGQTISTLPVHVVNRKSGEKLYDHPLARVLSSQPNPFMTPAVFREALMANALLWGGAGAAVARDAAGQVEAVYPLRSSDVRPVRRDGSLIYEARVGSNLYELAPDQIIYLLGWSMDGVTPMSPIRSGTQAVALDVAMGRYAAKAFGGANIGGILQMPKMSDDAMKAFVESWRKNYTGIDAAFRVAALPDPMKFIPTSMTPESATLIPARQNQVLEVARYYKVPPHLLGLMDKGSSFSSIEQQNMFFAQQCIQPWCVKLEQELASKCLLESEQADVEIKFNLDALLRASTSERYAAHNVGLQAGFITVNEVRKKEGLPPVAGGDTLRMPLHMAPIDSAPTPKPAADPSATRALLLAIVQRFVTKEAKAVQRAAAKRDGDQLTAWAETFYADHEQLVADALTPALRAAGLTLDPAKLAKRHCDGGVRLVESAIRQKLEAVELGEDIQSRAADLVDFIINSEGEDHAAAA